MEPSSLLPFTNRKVFEFSNFHFFADLFVKKETLIVKDKDSTPNVTHGRKETIMRQITLALWVLFLSLCIVGGAMAAPPTKPPAGICFSLDLPFSSSLQMTLAIKPMGAVTMADGSTRFYAINGVLFNPDNTSPWVAPVSGTGYVQKVPGSTYLNGVYVSVDVSGYYVLGGDGLINYQTSDGFHSTYHLWKADCDGQTIPLPVD